ncbi:MAG: OmpP1/FadL family transporter [Bacteriovoracaceae bacterium]
MFNFSLFFLLAFVSSAYADMEHNKNTLIGGRAATLAGAYTAISDDASGAFYNPAGLTFASGNSFSGSANVYSIKNSTYRETIGANDWVRKSNNLKPNFFGVVQKHKQDTFALSYALTDSFTEHQDQIYQNIGGVTPVDVYALNLHSEDNTYLAGPSWARKINDKISVGASSFFHYRLYRRAYSQYVRFSDGTDESTFTNTTKKEKGIKPKLGVMYTPMEKLSLGLTFAKTNILTSLQDNQQNQKLKGASTLQFGQNSNTQKRKTPFEIETGAAYFYSPYLLFSTNLDLYLYDNSSKKNVINLSAGSEYYLAEKHAVRGGLYTNRTNSHKPTNTSSAPLEHINLYGITAGYTYYAQNSAITFGTVYSHGKGKAQIYSGSSATRDFVQNNVDFILSADYGF